MANDARPVRVVGISGSLRKGSYNTMALKAAMALAPEGMTIEAAEIGDLPHYNDDVRLAGYPPEVERFRAQLAAADAILFVTPEYNYSIPGVLKNAIDWASRPGYASVMKGKPVFIASVSGGALGGVRAQAHLKNVLGAVLAQTFVWQEVAITHANTKTKDGLLADEATETFLFEALRAFFGTLRSA